MEPESKSTSFTVDEDGDLVLLVGAGTRILVSSKVLTLASKVFKAMLSRSTFTEGRELAESAAKNEPYEMPLPDDNAQAMTILCQIIHHRARGFLVDTVTIDLLEKLAIVTDKYACADAIGFASRYWLEQYDNASSEDRIMITSYLFNDAKVFNSSSRRALMTSKGDFSALREKFDPNHMVPERLFVSLETQRTMIIRYIVHLITGEIDAMLNGDVQLGNEHGCMKVYGIKLTYLYSRHDAQRSHAFLKEMREKVKWPELDTCSIQDAVDGLLAISKLSPSLGGQKESSNLHCWSCKNPIPEIAAKIMKSSLEYIKGLCLDCIQAPDGQGTNCRTRH